MVGDVGGQGHVGVAVVELALDPQRRAGEVVGEQGVTALEQHQGGWRRWRGSFRDLRIVEGVGAVDGTTGRGVGGAVEREEGVAVDVDGALIYQGAVEVALAAAATGDLDDAVGFQLAIGPAGEVYREAGKLAEARHDEIAGALRAQLAKYKGPDGVMMDSSSWKVTASNPGS